MIFTRHDDGRVTVDEWPPALVFSKGYLRGAGSGMWYSEESGDLSLRASNGSADYHRLAEMGDLVEFGLAFSEIDAV